MAKIIQHPLSCRGFTVRYQWVAEMCNYRRTEADIVGVLIGYTESEHEKIENVRNPPEEWDQIEISIAKLAALTSTSHRTVQTALRWLEAHEVISVHERTGKGGINKRWAYRLVPETMDMMVYERDSKQVPMMLVRTESGVKAVRITPEEPEMGVQKLQGAGAKTAPPPCENCTPTVQKLQGTSVQKLHPCYNGQSLEESLDTIPTPAESGGEDEDDREDFQESYDEEREGISYTWKGRGYTPSMRATQDRRFPLPGERFVA